MLQLLYAPQTTIEVRAWQPLSCTYNGKPQLLCVVRATQSPKQRRSAPTDAESERAHLVANTPFEVVEPHAAVLAESLRAFGYSLEAALADLIDNSISAEATRIAVVLKWNDGQPLIAVADNGKGMTTAQLREAMRPGSQSPLDTRSPSDLGRFGLGLKTASFSQCRRLVVLSATENMPEPTARVWDLDHISSTGQWQLGTAADPADRSLWAATASSPSGTLVIWRKPDRFLDDRANSLGSRGEKHFFAAADRVVRHLQMTFHRIITGSKPLVITVNGRQLTPWDPFLESHETTQIVADEYVRYRGERIRVKIYVLPHPNHLTEDQRERAAGPRGWASQQGFYIYRNRRMIVSGSWLGMRLGRDDQTRLARIRVDLPNSMDQDWQIDVRKSVARAPAAIAPDLDRLARVARERSARAFHHRSIVLDRKPPGDVAPVWEQHLRDGQVTYRVNQAHPAIEALLGVGGREVRILLRLLQETVPVPSILQDHTDGHSAIAPKHGDDDSLRLDLSDLVRIMASNSLDWVAITRRLSAMEPFCNYPELIAEVVDNVQGKKGTV